MALFGKRNNSNIWKSMDRPYSVLYDSNVDDGTTTYLPIKK